MTNRDWMWLWLALFLVNGTISGMHFAVENYGWAIFNGICAAVALFYFCMTSKDASNDYDS